MLRNEDPWRDGTLQCTCTPDWLCKGDGRVAILRLGRRFGGLVVDEGAAKAEASVGAEVEAMQVG